ncbi:MAG: hypothetical protein O2826_08535 [Chloroflexi bacterium]|nr:hypothetical protein [Chloroflexota bacterium]MDA1174546.1 hypothetical protein [Chloroflexota bacterium]
MGVASKRTVFGALALLIAFVAASMFVAFQPDAQAAKKPKADFQIDLFVTGLLPSEVVAVIEEVAEASGRNPRTPAFTIDSFFDVTYSTMDSSGKAGSGASSFTVDSFFDVTYDLEPHYHTWGSRMVSLSFTGIFGDHDFAVSAAEQVLDSVSPAVLVRTKKAGVVDTEQHEYVGHVTLLR